MVLNSLFWFNGGVVQQSIVSLGEADYLDIGIGEKRLLSYILVTLSLSIITGSLLVPFISRKLGEGRTIIAGTLLMALGQLSLLSIGSLFDRAGLAAFPSARCPCSGGSASVRRIFSRTSSRSTTWRYCALSLRSGWVSSIAMLSELPLNYRPGLVQTAGHRAFGNTQQPGNLVARISLEVCQHQHLDQLRRHLAQGSPQIQAEIVRMRVARDARTPTVIPPLARPRP